MRSSGPVFDAHFLDIELHLDPVPLELRAAMTRPAFECGIDWGEDGALWPRCRFAPGVNRRLQALRGEGDMVIRSDTDFPAPNHFHA